MNKGFKVIKEIKVVKVQLGPKEHKGLRAIKEVARRDRKAIKAIRDMVG